MYKIFSYFLLFCFIFLNGCVTNASADISSKEATNQLSMLSEKFNSLDKEKVIELLEAGANINVRNQYGVTPLQMAANDGQTELVALLTAYENCDVDAASEPEGLTSLYIATQNGYTKIVKLLIEANADPDKGNKLGCSDKYISSSEGEFEVAKENCLTTPLQLAVHKNFTDIVKLLLDAGADPKISGSDGTAIEIATKNKNTKILALLQNAHLKSSQKPKNQYGDELIIISEKIKPENLTDIKRLISAGANINIKNTFGATTLFMASQNGCNEIVKYLINNNADINQTFKGATPLWIASQQGHIDIVESLLDANCDVNNRIGTGETPLYVASQNGHLEIVKMLLKNKAEIEFTHDDGMTPLYKASEKGHERVVKILLENKANPNIANNKGITPLFIASQYGHANIVKLLVKYHANIEKGYVAEDVTPLWVASLNGFPEIVKVLVKAKCNVNAPTRSEKITPLMAASLKGHADIVELLLNNNADPNMVNSKGENALQVASNNGHNDVVKLLTKRVQ